MDGLRSAIPRRAARRARKRHLLTFIFMTQTTMFARDIQHRDHQSKARRELEQAVRAYSEAQAIAAQSPTGQFNAVDDAAIGKTTHLSTQHEPSTQTVLTDC
jgi:hypothetical protein